VKIGLVTDFYYPWIGGPATVVRSLGQGLLALGHEVALLAPSPHKSRHLESDGDLWITRAATMPVPFGYGVRVASHPFRDAREWLDRVQPDVVHFHHPFPLSAAAARLARGRGLAVVATNHTVPECSLWGIRDTGLLYRIGASALARWLLHVLSYADSVATPTVTAAERLRELGHGRPIQAISNGVDTTRFAPGTRNRGLRRRLRLDDRPVVLYTGRLDAEKQMDVWLRAAAAVTQQLDAQFVVGGRGKEEDRLARLASTLHLDSHLTFIGYLADADFADLYRLADVYFITSPVELQSIGTLEAVASGLPVVAVQAGALPELVHDGENGFLVPAGDAERAATALLHIVRNPDLRRAQGERSRNVGLGHDLLRSVQTYERWISEAPQLRSGRLPVERIPASEP